MNEEYNFKKIEELNISSKLVKTIMFKPRLAPIICFIIGGCLMIVNNFLVRLLAAFFIIMAFVVFVYVEDKKVADIYEDGCLIYNSKDQSLGCFVAFKDIKEWEVSRESGHDSIIFTFNDGNRTFFDTFQANKAFDALNSVIHDKEKRVIQAKKNKEMHFELRNPLDWFKKKKK